MPIIINELVATIRPEPEAVAREVIREPMVAPETRAAVRAAAVKKEREARLVID